VVNYLSNKLNIFWVTGGIACGKSQLIHYLVSNMKHIVVDCDELARRVVEPNTKVYNIFVKRYGPHLLKENKEIDRSKLS
jgi:dephospho-CoA kinase